MPVKDPIDKLPLATRKNVRDEFESKKPDYESRISELTGETWKIEINAALIYVYAAETDDSYKGRVGNVIVWYLDAFMSNLKRFVEQFGDDGKNELNTVCSTHTLTLYPQDTTKFSYGGLEVADGILRIIFAEKKLGSNVDDASRDFAKALEAGAASSGGGASAYSITARNSVRDGFDAKIGEIQAEVGDMLGVPGIKLTGDFEGIAEILSKSKDARKDWDSSLGNMALAYFAGLKWQLGRQGFKGDDMLQEGFQEAVDKGEIRLRVLDKIKASYNETVIEDGVMYIQTTPKNWSSNVDDAAAKLLDLL